MFNYEGKDKSDTHSWEGVTKSKQVIKNWDLTKLYQDGPQTYALGRKVPCSKFFIEEKK